MTVSRIREAALFYFSRHGYEGTSLTQIAKDVGIKKPSLYAHFKGKEEIFFTCLDYALQSDRRFFQQFLTENDEQSAEQVLYALLERYKDMASHQVATMFCLRTLYFPPHAFKERLIEMANEKITQLGQLLSPLFERAQARGEMKKMNIVDAVEAYLCLFDGLMIELMYAGPERFQYRLRAAWHVFSQGLFDNKDRELMT